MSRISFPSRRLARRGSCGASLGPLALAALTALVTTGGCQEKTSKDTPQSAAPAAATPAEASTPDVRRPPKREPIPPPLPVAAPPADAQKTASGLSYVILSQGTKDEKPGLNDTVRVQYTAWSPDGETRFSTRHRNRPQGRYLPQQPPGWIETLTDMKLGEKRMVWMPPDAGYSGRGNKPTETMTYEIELVAIDRAPPAPANLTAPPPDAKKTASGIAYEVLAPGTGTERPKPWDQVAVYYTSWDASGKMLQTTHTRKKPQTVHLMRAAPGWTEVLSNMVIGQKVRAWIPASQLQDRHNMPKDGLVVHEFELAEITKQTPPPPVPKDVAKPPPDAKKTAKGVFYKVLKPGTGTAHPTAEQIVRVHYTGWTTDGKMFDSSVVRGSPTRFPLTNVIPGWTDGLQTMVVGETTRFWIPEALAYAGSERGPKGMLVFDVELFEISDPPKRPALPGDHPAVGGPPGTGPNAEQRPMPGMPGQPRPATGERPRQPAPAPAPGQAPPGQD
jgi:FKBP-type peptidyl-prolyl cis-trans isomerase